MPKELPGLYYDAEKNRYFRCKGPIPGSNSVKAPTSKPPQDDSLSECIKIKSSKLIQARELFGNQMLSRKGKISFQAEFLKRHAMQPMIWKYKHTAKMANIALEHAAADVILPHGIVERDILLSGGVNSMLRLHQIGRGKYENDPTQNFKVDRVWPRNIDQTPRSKDLLKKLGSSNGAMSYTTSDISCIKVSKKRTQEMDASKHFVVTTLGSEDTPGAVYILDLSQPLDFGAHVAVHRDGFYELASFALTLWAADSDPQGRHVAIGTNQGVVLVSMRNGTPSWLFRCTSDVLSVDYDQSGNTVLCGLRSGAIVIGDTRQRPFRWSRHNPSTLCLKSSICCLKTLKHTDQCFLASSMDESIKLFDQRLMRRGPIQSYEGNVNTHTRIELGVDPSEKVVMSGGEDCYLRMWDIKSGKMLFKDKFMNSIPSVVCWPRTGVFRDSQDYRCYWEDHNFGAWLGSYEGIFYMDWP